MTADCLAVADLHAGYGLSRVLRGVALSVPERGIVALLGRNGAGKTTTLRALMNLLRPERGTVTLRGEDVTALPTHEIARRGMTLVPEHRGMFGSLSVRESLAIAAGRRGGDWTVERILTLFPRLAERLDHRSLQLSGGEQQLLAIARALLLHPCLLLLDEPTEGLAPIIVRNLLNDLMMLKDQGMAMLLVEQNFAFARRLADHAVVLGKGVVQWAGPMAELQEHDDVTRTWLGV